MMTIKEFYEIPPSKVLYAPKVDRYFIKRSSKGDIVLWLSDKRELGYGGRGITGWTLKKLSFNTYRVVASDTDFKYGWDDSLTSSGGNESLLHVLKDYRKKKVDTLTIPTSFLTPLI